MSERCRVAVQSGHEDGDRVSLLQAHPSGIGRLEQRLVALLRVETRLGALIAERLHAGVVFDPGELVDDVGDGILGSSRKSARSGRKRCVFRRVRAAPAERGRDLFRDQLDRTQDIKI